MTTPRTSRLMRSLAFVGLTVLGSMPVFAAEPAVLNIDASKVQGTIEPRALGGTNVALWVGQNTYASPKVQQLMKDAGFGIIRLPGGSWSDVTFWNGNGVRDPQTGRVDANRWADGYPMIDYSGYAPTITVQDKPPHKINKFHGNVDVKVLHDFVQQAGAQQLVCVNGGTGRALDAAEWVKWANKTNNYGIRYWEVGNELDGGWEAGHYLADGSELTPAMYAKRFAEYAKAMKAMDPTVKVGGPASGVEANNSFAEAILRDCGDLVDFISIHTYPGNQTFTDAQQFARVSVVKEHVDRVKGWIEKYQPERKGQIEICYTEWNLPATRVACELDSALWSALFLREMAINGVNFATQWDAFTQGKTEAGGHALIWDSNGEAIPKAEYWAFAMWNANTGKEMLSSGKLEETGVEYLATRRGKDVYLMLVNTSREQEVTVRPQIAGLTHDTRTISTLTSAEYFWNPFTNRPDTSTGPSTKVGSGDLVVPAFSVSFVHYPEKPLEFPPASVAPAIADKLMLVMPESIYAGEEAEIWVRAFAGDRPVSERGLVAKVSAENGKLRGDAVRLSESAGRTYATATEAGVMTITVQAGDVRTSGKIEVKPSVPRPVVIWDAEEPVLDKDHKYESDWPMAKEMNVRPNEPVVRIDLKDALKTKQNLLLRMHFPEDVKIDKSGIRGAFADVRISPDFRCDDPNVSIQVLMQSESNWWMPIASFPITDKMRTDWVREEIKVTDPKQIEAMPQARNLWFILQTNKPVNGSIYFDRIGLMVR